MTTKLKAIKYRDSITIHPLCKKRFYYGEIKQCERKYYYLYKKAKK